MNQPHRTAVAALLATCALTSCSSSPDLPIRPASAAWQHLQAADFPGAPRLLDGFDAPTDDGEWMRKDRLLFALQLRKGETVHRWLLHLEVMIGDMTTMRLGDDRPSEVKLWNDRSWTYTTTVEGEKRQHVVTSRMLPVVVRVHDEQGKQLGNSLVQMPADLLGAGLLPGIDAARTLYGGTDPDAEHMPREQQEAHVTSMVRSTMALVALLTIVQEDSVLADYFWQVIEKPSIWSVVSSFGVSASLVTALEQSLPTDDLPPGMPDLGRAFVAPMRVEVNGSPALLADILATKAVRPYALCGGMVAASARHPSRPELHFDVQLLAARLGARSTGTVKSK